jgi:multidrug efflux system membrane fusion protein
MANASEPRPRPERDLIGPEPRRFPWLTIIILFVMAGLMVGFVMVNRGKKGGTQAKGPGGGREKIPVPAVLGTVAQKDFPLYLDGLGTVQAFNSVTVRSRVDGQLQKLAFEEGQDVYAGQLLAQIDPAPYQAQVAQAEAKKAQDEAQLANAKLELKRDETLLASKIVAQDVYDAQAALVKQFEAGVQADRAAIDSARVQLNYTTISAPIDGRTGLRLVDAGNIIRAADSNGIVVLTQLHPISLVFTLPEQSLSQIHREQAQGPLKIRALDRDNKTLLDEGTLTVVDNQIDTSTGTIRLKGTFSNASLKLWPGQFVNARLLLTVRSNATVVPASVVQRGPEGPYAFAVNDDMSVRMVPVQVGPSDQGQVLIERGLAPGDRVVVDGQFKLQPGSLVKAAQPVGAPGRTNASPQVPEKQTRKSS